MSQPERVFNTFQRKPFRPFYSFREFIAGIIILILLAAVVLWLEWRGAHPDPDLFLTREKLLTSKGGQIPVYKRPLERWVEPGGVAPNSTGAAANPLEPFPASVAGDGWQASGSVSTFDETNLYTKIDGREGFYKSFGFQKLYTLSLESSSEKNLTIDLELFDLGSIENAIGALTAEIPDEKAQASVKLEPSGLSYFTSNAGFASQGKYYVRMVGSDANPVIEKRIQAIKKDLLPKFPVEKLPWTYALFAGQLGVNPGQIRFEKENVFSLSSVTNVYSAILPGSTETQLFITKRSGNDDATKLAKQIGDSFASYGKVLKQSPYLIQNEYIQVVDGVQPYQQFVIGIRFAKSASEAVNWMDKLKAALQKVQS
ncbi:MAG: hypothetical protein C5B54_11890 [Acidobacteria bacterium]|nr:MAG: hypothetical protein C5B54_11890 [Acidobacteriota bacterium]